MRFTRGTLLLPLLATLALGACDGTTGAGGDAARISIRLTDAPGDLDEAWVKVQRIYLQGEGSATAGRHDLLDTPTDWIDLLTLSGGRTAELVNGEVVPAGRYSELRFVVCEAWVRTSGGKIYASQGVELPAGATADGTLRMPSACQSGFKVKLPGDGVELENGSNILVVDFDVSRTFGHQAGNSGQWIMHPVAHATNVTFSGGIRGAVTLAEGVALPACGGADVNVSAFVPRAVAAADTISGTTTAEGTYTLGPVHPGTYGMEYAEAVSFTNGDTLRFTAAAAPPTVTVGSGGSVTSDFTVTAATCKAAS